MILSFLQWNTTSRNADKALTRLIDAFVDFNELRVTMAHQVIELIGPDYPQAQERIERMQESLHEVFQREQAVNLDVLAKKSKKDVRAYLDCLPGTPPYVAAQMTLLCFEGHAVPVDDQLADLLRQGEIIEQDTTIAQIESFLERCIKADVARQTHAILTAWVDAGPRRLSPVGNHTKKKPLKQK